MDRYTIDRLWPPEDDFYSKALEFVLERRLDYVPDAREWQGLHRLIQAHQLSGLFYSRLKPSMPGDLVEEFGRHWKMQFLRNQVHQELLEDLGVYLQERNHSVVPLKGASLQKRLYGQTGERFQSDIDLLLPRGDFEAAIQFLMERRFARALDDILSPHKNVWHGEVGGLEVTVEIHRRLFAEEPPKWFWQTTKSGIPGLRYLTLEQELFFLIHHVAHQHTFLKLFWLRDIALFLKRYGGHLDWGEVWHLAEQFHREKSVMAVLLLMVRFGPEGCCEDWMAWDIGRKGRWVLSRITPKFLWHVRENLFSYFFVKHGLKDTWGEAITYDIRWLKSRVSRAPN